LFIFLLKNARKIDQETKFYFNDYNSEGYLKCMNNLFIYKTLFKDMVGLDILIIYGIGIQYNIHTMDYPTYKGIKGLIDKYDELGL